MKKFLKAFIIILVVFVILPAAFVFIFIYDNSKMSVRYDKEFSKEDWSKALVVDSLDNAKTEKVARFEATEADLNNLIHSSMKGNTEFNKYVTQLALDITNDSYVVNLSAKWNFFETRTKLSAKLQKMIVINNGIEEEAYVLSVDKISLGRLPQLKDVVMFFLRQFSNSSTLDTIGASLKIHTDLKNACIFIYASDLRDLLSESMKNQNGGQSEFYFTFINDFLDHNLLKFNFYNDNKFTVDIELEKLTGNDYGSGEYVYDKYKMSYEDTTTKLMIDGEEKTLSLDVIRDAVVYLLDNHVISEAQIGKISDYLFNGYNGENAPECNLSSIGITNKMTYQGFNVEKKSMDEAFKNKISSFDGYNLTDDSFEIANIQELDVNDYMKSQNMLGMKYFLYRQVETSKYKVNYIALDNAYINLFADKAILSAGLNLNGLETFITVPMHQYSGNEDKSVLMYEADQLYFGGTDENGKKLYLSGETESLIFETLKDSINDSSFSFYEEGILTIDFNAVIGEAKNMITDAPYKTFLNSASYEAKVEGDNVTDNSTIKIIASRS